MRRSITPIFLAMALGLVGACGSGTDDGGGGGGPTVTPPSNVPDDCAITLPDGSYTPPSEYPAIPQGEGIVWYGSDELWTALPADGDYSRRKSIWWSISFEGGGTEPKPEISVTWERLDEEGEVITSGPPGTQASTARDGEYMIGGTDPLTEGCWQVTADYKGASLTYVYYLD